MAPAAAAEAVAGPRVVGAPFGLGMQPLALAGLAAARRRSQDGQAREIPAAVHIQTSVYDCALTPGLTGKKHKRPAGAAGGPRFGGGLAVHAARFLFARLVSQPFRACSRDPRGGAAGIRSFILKGI